MDENDKFHGQLGEVVRIVGQHDMVFLKREFNIKVFQEYGVWRDVKRVYGTGTRNNNGQRLPEFCDDHHLCVTNVIFNSKV